ncbi:MAG: sugar transferase [Candidatus Pacebacteria bacterium]|nr:sugar transferase [Candidatus Paceibacterota bacterium]
MPRIITLLSSDFVSFYGALAVTLLLRYGRSDFTIQFSRHVVPFSLLLLVWLFALYITNLYNVRFMRNDREFFERLAQAMLFAAVISIIFFYLIPFFGITPKRNLFIFLILLAIGMWGMRLLYNRILAGSTKKNILIVGITKEAIELATFITNNPQLGYRISSFVHLNNESIETTTSATSWGVIHNLNEVDAHIIHKSIDTVVITPDAYQLKEVVDLFYSAISRQINFISLTSLTEQLTGRIPLGSINQTWFLNNLEEGSKKSLDPMKRFVDIASATLLGIPTLIALPFIAAIILVDSRGPVFFRQARTGRAGTPFSIIKFRTMKIDAEATTGAVWATQNDSRITRVGSLLRKTRIDELPQLWNILRGDMSLVGPRAERPEFDAQLALQIPFYNERYLIKPGLSGWAQINYPYGASVEDALQKLQYDLYYIKHRSILLDLEIVLKTISISLRRSGR